MKKIVLTGGGSAGHVTPHLALLPHLLKEGYEVHYIGTQDGIEHGMVGNLPGVTYHVVKSGKLRRYFDWKNFTDPFRVIAGAFQSAHLMRRLKPDVCFSKGGFVSVPVVVGAWLHHVPVLCHESDLTPGLANKICARFAKKVATTFPECAQALAPKGVFTGTPLRPELFSGSREKGLAMAHFTADKPVLLMMGGSLGAQSVNAALRAALPKLLPHMQVLHLCGKGNLDESLIGTEGYVQYEYIKQELADLFALSDIVISRAGANAICELNALKKPNLLIPLSANASRGDQILNARSFERQGFSMVLEEEEITESTLLNAIRELYQNRESYVHAMSESSHMNSIEKITGLIEDCVNKQ